jgi:hypothetical protein
MNVSSPGKFLKKFKPNKIPLKFINFRKEEKNIQKRLRQKYLTQPDWYLKKVINQIIFDEKNRLVSRFKDYLIFDDLTDMLKRYYKISECHLRLPKIYEYYDSFTQIFPNYNNLPEAKYIYKNIERKQRIINDQEENIMGKILVTNNSKRTSRMNSINRNTEEDNIFNTEIMNSILNESKNIFTKQEKYKEPEGVEEFLNENNSQKDISTLSMRKLIEVIKDAEKNKESFEMEKLDTEKRATFLEKMLKERKVERESKKNILIMNDSDKGKIDQVNSNNAPIISNFIRRNPHLNTLALDVNTSRKMESSQGSRGGSIGSREEDPIKLKIEMKEIKFNIRGESKNSRTSTMKLMSESQQSCLPQHRNSVLPLSYNPPNSCNHHNNQKNDSLLSSKLISSFMSNKIMKIKTLNHNKKQKSENSDSLLLFKNKKLESNHRTTSSMPKLMLMDNKKSFNTIEVEQGYSIIKTKKKTILFGKAERDNLNLSTLKKRKRYESSLPKKLDSSAKKTYVLNKKRTNFPTFSTKFEKVSKDKNESRNEYIINHYLHKIQDNKQIFGKKTAFLSTADMLKENIKLRKEEIKSSIQNSTLSRQVNFMFI